MIGEIKIRNNKYDRGIYTPYPLYTIPMNKVPVKITLETILIVWLKYIPKPYTYTVTTKEVSNKTLSSIDIHSINLTPLLTSFLKNSLDEALKEFSPEGNISILKYEVNPYNIFISLEFVNP